MAAAEDQGQLVPGQGLALRPRRQGRAVHGEGQVHPAGPHPLHQVRAIALHPQAQPRRLPPQTGHDPGQDRDPMGVAGGDAEGALGQGRIEVPPGQQGAQVGHGLRQGTGHGLGHGRRGQTAPVPHQQRVAQQVPQPGQGPAHGRLAQARLLRRLGDIAPPQQGLQQGQQVQVHA